MPCKLRLSHTPLNHWTVILSIDSMGGCIKPPVVIFLSHRSFLLLMEEILPCEVHTPPNLFIISQIHPAVVFVFAMHLIITEVVYKEYLAVLLLACYLISLTLVKLLDSWRERKWWKMATFMHLVPK